MPGQQGLENEAVVSLVNDSRFLLLVRCTGLNVFNIEARFAETRCWLMTAFMSK